MLYYFYLNS